MKLSEYTWKHEKFFDPLAFYIPKSLKEVLKYCRYFYETNHIISAIVYKLAEYPITDLIYETDDEQLKELYHHILEEEMDIKRVLIEVGLDYFVYGNAFVTVLPPFKRVFKCSKCDRLIEPKTESGRRNWRIYNKQLRMECPVHGDVPVVVKDVVTKTNDFRIARWDPMRITIDYSELSQTRKIYYNMPNDEIRRVHTDPETLKKIRKPFLEAIIEGKDSVLFEEDKVYVFQRPSISHEFKGWGLPPLLHVLQLMFYIQMLRRAQFAIAEDRLLNFRYLYPPTEYVLQSGPFSANLATWKTNVENALKEWREDPNHIPIFPVPIAYGSITGEGKSLMLFPEIEQLISELIVGLQVPREFVYGGLTWSGSSVSLRMLENHYLNYRAYLSSLLNYITKTIALVKDVPHVKVRFRPFRMADDVQRAQLKLQLSNMGKISDTTLLSEFDMDYKTEMEKKITDAKKQILAQQELQMFQLQLQSALQSPPAQEMSQQEEEPIDEVVDMTPLPEQKPPRRVE